MNAEETLARLEQEALKAGETVSGGMHHGAVLMVTACPPAKLVRYRRGMKGQRVGRKGLLIYVVTWTYWLSLPGYGCYIDREDAITWLEVCQRTGVAA